MQQLLLFFHIVVCVSLVGLVLVQHGKGADMGVAFGGSSGSVFGSQGSTAFLVKLTAFIAALFFMSSLVLGYWSGHLSRQNAVLQGISAQKSAVVPVEKPALKDIKPVEKKPSRKA